jgi:hypothetical protein
MYDENLIRLSLSFPLANVKRINFGACREASDHAVCEAGWHLLYCRQFKAANKKCVRSTAAERRQKETSAPRRAFYLFVAKGEREKCRRNDRKVLNT